MNDVSNWVLVLITAFYAVVTYRILKANERTVAAMSEQLIAAMRPYVEVSVRSEPDHGIISLRIANTGRRPAERLRLSIDKPFYRFADVRAEMNIATYAAFTQETATLPPGSELLYHLGNGIKIYGDKSDPPRCPQVFTIRAVYHSANQLFDEITTVDLRAFHSTAIASSPVAEAAERIDNAIRETAKQIARTIRGDAA